MYISCEDDVWTVQVFAVALFTMVKYLMPFAPSPMVVAEGSVTVREPEDVSQKTTVEVTDVMVVADDTSSRDMTACRRPREPPVRGRSIAGNPVSVDRGESCSCLSNASDSMASEASREGATLSSPDMVQFSVHTRGRRGALEFGISRAVSAPESWTNSPLEESGCGLGRAAAHVGRCCGASAGFSCFSRPSTPTDARRGGGRGVVCCCSPLKTCKRARDQPTACRLP